VVLEMTTNALTVYDEISPQVHSVTVVHPPYVALVARARGKTDRKAALILAQLHAAGLLPPLWVPPNPRANCAPWWPNGLRWRGWPPRHRIVCTPCSMGHDNPQGPLLDARQPQGLQEIIHLARGDPLNTGTLHYGQQGSVRSPPGSKQ